MVVTQPFNYGNVLQQAAQINGLEQRNALLAEQTNALQARQANEQQFNALLGAGDIQGAMAVDPMRAQQFQLREQQGQAFRLGQLQQTAPQAFQILDSVANSQNAAQMAPIALDQLEQFGWNVAPLRESLKGAPTNEAIIQAAKNLREYAGSMLQPQAQPDFQLREITNADGSTELVGIDPTNPANVVSTGVGSAAPLPDKEDQDKLLAAAAKSEGELRKEFSKMTSEFRDVDAAYSRVIASAQDPSAAGDLALIFNYMKMLDPGSTVREGEFANAENAGGIPQRIMARYNSIINGERLDPTVRADFVDRAGSLYQASANSAQRQADFYNGLAEQRDLNPANVTGGFAVQDLFEPDQEPITLQSGATIRRID